MAVNEQKKYVENPFKRDKVIAMIQSRGLTLLEFSEKSGIALSSLSAWLRGFRHPKLANIHKIAKCLQCKIADISTYDNPYLEERLTADPFTVVPLAPNAIQNSAELRECIKDAMMAHGITETAELSRLIGYDSPELLERLLAGKLNWFPDILSAVSHVLKIKHDDLPITPNERYMLAPNKIFNQGAVLVRQIPVIGWLNAPIYICRLLKGMNTVNRELALDFAETIPAPTGCSPNTIALRIDDQSMWPKIQEGDILLCEPVENLIELPNNRIVVVLFKDSAKNYAGSVICRRFQRVDEKIFLTSDHPSSRLLENINPADIAWIGRVIGKYDKDF